MKVGRKVLQESDSPNSDPINPNELEKSLNGWQPKTSLDHMLLNSKKPGRKRLNDELLTEAIPVPETEEAFKF